MQMDKNYRPLKLPWDVRIFGSLYVAGAAVVSAFIVGFVGAIPDIVRDWDTLLEDPNKMGLEAKAVQIDKRVSEVNRAEIVKEADGNYVFKGYNAMRFYENGKK